MLPSFFVGDDDTKPPKTPRRGFSIFDMTPPASSDVHAAVPGSVKPWPGREVAWINTDALRAMLRCDSTGVRDYRHAYEANPYKDPRASDDHEDIRFFDGGIVLFDGNRFYDQQHPFAMIVGIPNNTATGKWTMSYRPIMPPSGTNTVFPPLPDARCYYDPPLPGDNGRPGRLLLLFEPLHLHAICVVDLLPEPAPLRFVYNHELVDASLFAAHRESRDMQLI